MALAGELAKRINSMRYEDLPEEALHWAKVAILDTIGVTLAGCREECTRCVGRVLGAGGGEGPCALLGQEIRTGPLDAAQINGTAAHALDYDDCNNTMGGHPSVPLVPGLLALGETLGAAGRDLLLAYVVGFETETKIARGVHFHHYEKGWHPTATLGTFGAAAACGRLLGLSDAQLETALALSVSLAAGVKANFGTMTKPLHIGNTARNGLFAALLAREGFTANPEAFEHKQGFLEVFNGAGTYDTGRILDEWARPLDVVSPGVAIKQYPCCGSTHPAVDAARQIARAEGFDPAGVAGVRSRLHRRRLEHTNRPDPRSPLEAKFSVQYVVSRALLHGGVYLEHFDEGAYLEPEVRRMLRRVEAEPIPYETDNHFGAEVDVKMTDGRQFSAKVDRALGRGSDNPLPEEVLREKFENCCGRVLPKEGLDHLYGVLKNLEALENARELTGLLTVGAGEVAV